ncbi:hypothetical protein KR009_004067, partial [Drosophila setifemur]
ISCKFEFTNTVCKSFDKEFADFRYCYLKSVNRSYKYMSFRLDLYKPPITKIKFNLIIFKRVNGYRPFMYNITVDGCRWLGSIDSNPFMAFLYGIFKGYTNMNHTCPYDHDMWIEKLPISVINHHLTKVLPVPEGDYLLEYYFRANDVDLGLIKVKGTVS